MNNKTAKAAMGPIISGFQNHLIAGSNQTVFDCNNASNYNELQLFPSTDFDLREDLLRNHFWRDENKLHKQIIERRDCKTCGAKLVYEGLSDPTNYYVFSNCLNCKDVKFFRHLSDISVPTFSVDDGTLIYLEAAA